MRQPVASGDVADGANARNVGTQVVVHQNGTSFAGGHADAIQVKALGVWNAPHGCQNLLCSQAALSIGSLDDNLVAFEPLDGSVGENTNAFLLQEPGDPCGDLRILIGKNRREELYQCDPNAEGSVHGGELDTHCAATHDQQTLGKLRLSQGLAAGPRAFQRPQSGGR